MSWPSIARPPLAVARSARPEREWTGDPDRRRSSRTRRERLAEQRLEFSRHPRGSARFVGDSSAHEITRGTRAVERRSRCRFRIPDSGRQPGVEAAYQRWRKADFRTTMIVLCEDGRDFGWQRSCSVGIHLVARCVGSSSSRLGARRARDRCESFIHDLFTGSAPSSGTDARNSHCSSERFRVAVEEQGVASLAGLRWKGRAIRLPKPPRGRVSWQGKSRS